MSSGTVVYTLPFILSFQIFAKLRKIIMGKREKNPTFETLPLCTESMERFSKDKGKGKYEHYSFFCSYYQSKGSTDANLEVWYLNICVSNVL